MERIDLGKVIGPQGPQGIKGDKGLASLSVNRVFSGTYDIGGTSSLAPTEFNRTPVVGDYFMTVDGSSYLDIFQVTSVTSSSVAFKCVSRKSITSIAVDTALSSTSANPVQNKVVNTALAGKEDKLVTKTYTLPTLTTAGTRYVKLATFPYDKSASFSIEMRGVNLIEHIDINVNSGNGTVPAISGCYATNLGYIKRIICHPTANSWNTTFEVWLEYTQYTTCTVYLSYDKRYESYINTNSTLNVTTSSTSGVNYYLPYNTNTKGGIFGRVNCESLWSGTSSTGAQTITLTKTTTNFSFILVEACMYSSPLAQRVYSLIPSSQVLVQTTTEDKDNFLFVGSLSDETRRLRFYFPTVTTLYKLASNGVSGHQPVITNVWGIM